MKENARDKNPEEKLPFTHNSPRMHKLYDQFINNEATPKNSKQSRKLPKTFNKRTNQLNQLKYINDLHQIAALGLLKRLQVLEKNPQKLSQLLLSKDNGNRIPLDIACAHGHYEIAEKLLKAHNELKTPYIIMNRPKNSPLITAIRSYLDTLRKFYDLNKPLDSKNKQIHERYEKTIVLLIKEQPEFINVENINGRNALFYVVKEMGLSLPTDKRKNTENFASKLPTLKGIAKILLATDITLDNQKCSVIELAKTRNVNELLDELILTEPTRNNAQLTTDNRTNHVITQEQEKNANTLFNELLLAKPNGIDSLYVDSFFLNIQSEADTTTQSNTSSIEKKRALETKLLETPISQLGFYKNLNANPLETSIAIKPSRHAFAK